MPICGALENGTLQRPILMNKIWFWRTFYVTIVLDDVKNNSTFKDLDKGEREDLLTELNLRFSGHNRAGVYKLLIEYDFSEIFANAK